MALAATPEPCGGERLRRSARGEAKDASRATGLPKDVTLGELFTLYLRHRTPTKAEATQLEGKRRAGMFLRHFGTSRKARAISLPLWESFIRERSSGAIDSRGREVPARRRRPVGPRTVEADLTWLRAVLNWGTKWQTEVGQYLLDSNPIRGFEMPRELNPRRPMATRDRLEKLLEVSDGVLMHVWWSGTREQRRSHLTELLVLAAGTGRRISAILKLTYADLILGEAPYGSIRWRAENDKVGRESVVPVSPEVRGALDRLLRERPGIGNAPLFPAPKDYAKSCRYELAAAWLREAERVAGLPKHEGGLWHPFRRKWATERKHLPDVDVAAAGGWANALTLKTVYQKADARGMLGAVLGGGWPQRREGR